MLAMLRHRTQSAVARPLAVCARSYGTSLPIPTPPAGSETVFSSRMQMPKYSISNPKWFALFFAMNTGVYLGHFFYLKFVMSANPPNPPRNPDEVRPEKHMHTVEDED